MEGSGISATRASCLAASITLSECREVEAGPGRPLWYAGVDVRNAFFQHWLPAWVSSYFGLDPVSAGELGISSLKEAN